MSSGAVEIRTCPDGRSVFQWLYDGAPDACASGGSVPATDPDPGYLTSPTGPNGRTLAPWLSDPAAQPATNSPDPDPKPEGEKECSCKKGRKDGPRLILAILTLLWLTS